jgi:ubiquinone/menaquinone biosynthesis C-methylase UbiE
MSSSVDLYNSSYGNYESDVYRRVRLDTYGHDLGQTSWVTKEESARIPHHHLKLHRGSHVLEIGSGSGRYAMHLAETIGCRVIGVDVNKSGVELGNGLAGARGLADRLSFQYCDVANGIPFPDETFHAAFANDVLCHIPERPVLLAEIWRVLKPGGLFLFSDALVIGGALSHHEIATRSSIGYYLFNPVGYNEQLLLDAGFRLLEKIDSTQDAAEIARRWRDARESRRQAIQSIEGPANFEGIQRFLSCVSTLCAEKRLLRLLYTAEKPPLSP